ncbi:hypothetical protein [Chelativorans sp. AA-79]|uniref:hypothetical protein n=1 Tax=Chelativorans sp. AA-79 TaxID=3028735 RepID=UPI0023F6D4EE|nr:hypothetical protein [Chelativorans sp. AA-79]WEX10640.1 hypothetical protein PVE73_06695 [Chelativorans sp. AA-79]
MRAFRLAIAAFAWLSVGAAAAPAAEETAPSLTAVTADLRENTLSGEEIRGITALSSVRVVDLQSLSGADRQELEETLRESEDNFAEVRTAIEANEAIEAELRKRDVSLSNVTAVTRAETGALTVYMNAPVP